MKVPFNIDPKWRLLALAGLGVGLAYSVPAGGPD
jgi:hypothetical protein